MIDTYKDWGYGTPEPLCSAPYVYPAILEILPPGGKVLDVGCGNGALVGEMLQRGYQATGVDLSRQGIEIARREYPKGRFEVLAADQLEELGEQFDAVVSTEVVEHLYDPGAFVRSCRRVLQPGGKLVLSTPYHGYLKNLAIALAAQWDRHHHPEELGGHIKFFSRQTLAGLLHDAGFQQVDFRGTGRLPYLWKSMVITGVRT